MEYEWHTVTVEVKVRANNPLEATSKVMDTLVHQYGLGTIRIIDSQKE